LEYNNLNAITYFPDSLVKGIALPVRFTFPFNYEPHPLTKIATAELQDYLETQADIDHNFGLVTGGEGAIAGKMFGVLVVMDREGKLGYLSAFSGKLAGSNHHPKFVPPVFDMLTEDSFFLKGIKIINTINQQIKQIEEGADYKSLKADFERSSALFVQETAALKEQLKINKAARKKQRAAQNKILQEGACDDLEASLIRQSLYDKHVLNVLVNKWEQVLSAIQRDMEQTQAGMEALKNERRELSGALQKQLFEQYEFLNKYGVRKSLQSIFKDTALGKPPSAAGECATPKLLQYAFLNGYQPVAMAEFWWGAAPRSEIRKHKQFYPACEERCRPILKHMLEGITLEEDPAVKKGSQS